jgi:hypothetical protein
MPSKTKFDFFSFVEAEQFLLLFLLLFLFLFPHFQLHQRAHARGDDARALVVLCSLMLVGIEGGENHQLFWPSSIRRLSNADATSKFSHFKTVYFDFDEEKKSSRKIDHVFLLKGLWSQ